MILFNHYGGVGHGVVGLLRTRDGRISNIFPLQTIVLKDDLMKFELESDLEMVDLCGLCRLISIHGRFVTVMVENVNGA